MGEECYIIFSRQRIRVAIDLLPLFSTFEHRQRESCRKYFQGVAFILFPYTTRLDNQPQREWLNELASPSQPIIRNTRSSLE